MDVAGERQAIESKLRVVAEWENSPITHDISMYLKEETESCVNLICTMQVVDIGTLVTHFQSIGHLAALRDMQRMMCKAKDDTTEELENLQ